MINRISKLTWEHKIEIHLFASSKDIEKDFGFVRNVLVCVKKWLRSECLEKCLHHGSQPGITPPVALFGAGAEIKHLELEHRYSTLDVSHSKGNSLDDKKLLMLIENLVSGVCGFHKFTDSGRDGEYNEKWGRIAFLTPDAAQKAVELNGVEFCGSSLNVAPARAYAGGGKLLHCEINSKCMNSVIIRGLDREISKPEILEIQRMATDMKILDVFLVRGTAVDDPPCGVCESELHKEISPFLPSHTPLSNCCHVKTPSGGSTSFASYRRESTCPMSSMVEDPVPADVP
ncbi:RNA helicase [Sarracenia purpurea var. burkii]